MADLTFYPSLEIVRSLGWTDRPTSKTKPPPATDVMFSFVGNDDEMLQRGIICRCYAGKYFAVTARQTDRLAKGLTLPADAIPRPDMQAYVRGDRLRQWPTDSSDAGENNKRRENGDLVRKMWDLAGDWPISPPGLIVIAGETGSRKTTFAREIARRHISLQMSRKVRPHLVTYEDPIESWFAYTPQQASAAGFEYTPRQKGTDVSDLDQAVTEALRQKPALLYVNEVRTERDWKALLFFAATGHVAITTTHAGSLVETFERIFNAARANTAARRSEIAARIVAIVHVKMLIGHVVPSVWLQSDRSRMALTQEGLGSLLPASRGGCFGRAHFADKLQLPPEVFRAAVQSDLRGD